MGGANATGSAVVPATEPSSVACLRSLARRGIHTISVAPDESAPAFASRYADEKWLVPDPGEDLLGYRDALLSLAKRADVRTILPIWDEDTWVLSRYRHAFEQYIRPLWPPVETVETVLDRTRLVRAATRAGVAAPETRTLDEVDDWDRKLIVKPRYSVLTHEFVDSISPTETVYPPGVRYLDPGVEPDRESIRADMYHDPIVQEYVPGTEYALWVLYDEGEAVATCQKHQIRGYSYAGNTSVARETTSIPALETAGRTLFDALEWHGPASAQFVRDERTGEFTLLEVNPRFWVSVQCAIQAGIDFPYYYWRLAGNEAVPAVGEYEVGVATHRLWGELQFLSSVLREDNPLAEPPPLSAAAWEVASSIVSQPHFDYLSVSDPAPFLRDLFNRVRRWSL